MNYLNFGCGSRWSPDWVNIDFDVTGPNVKQCNLLKGFPFPDNSFDAAYSSHVLEHFTLEQGEYLLKEALRVLKPGGLLRIVVPDLESTLREFVRLLDCHDGSALAEKKHEWITLELLDQLVRMENQGIVTAFKKQVLDSADEDLIAYVQSRAGDVFAAGADVAAESSFRSKLAKASLGKLRQKAIMTWVRIVTSLIPKSIAASIVDKTTLGEKHRWMYDSIGLERSVRRCGFRDIKFLEAATSQIPDFNNFELDIDQDGKAYKILSLYLEATKP